MLELKRKLGDKILIGDLAIEITVVQIAGGNVTLGISSSLPTRSRPLNVSIHDAGGAYEDVPCGRGG